MNLMKPQYGDILKIVGSWLEEHPVQISASVAGKMTISAAGTIVR
jgi:hypothetical protein